MRKVLPFILLLLASSPTAVAVERDKTKHAQAGFVLGMATHAALFERSKETKLYGSAVGCAAGLSKELYDSTGYGKSEMKDFLFTCGGAVIGSLFSDSAVVFPGSNGHVYMGWRVSF